ncbi:MAG: glycosyltransferase [bacterium]
MKKILITSLSNISIDSRVLKQVKTLLNNNFFVITAGFGKLNLNSKNHIHIEIENKHKLKFLFFSLNRFYKLSESLISLLNLNNIREFINPFILDIKNKLRSIDFDLIISNDLLTLPAIIYLFKLKNNQKPIILDLHEYFPEEFPENKEWKFFFKNFYIYLLKKYNKELKEIKLITVNESIAKLYKDNFNLNNIEIIINVPYYHNISPKINSTDKIKLVHVGGATISRKLENMILAFNHLEKDLRSNFELDFYLTANDEASTKYIEYLKELANKIENVNIKFLNPIPNNELVSKLSDYDIGLSYMYPSNINNLYCLPNKLFEYIQARLSILSSPNPEMAKIVKENDIGLVMEDYSPQSLAKSLKLFNKENIIKFKQNADKTAKSLNYENEAKKLINIINQLLK